MPLIANRFRLDALLGEGGMGQVHLAHDTTLARKVAVKLLPEASAHDPQARERLRREALAAAALDHPFICKVYEVGEHDGRSFIVMELVEGRTLDRVIRDGDLTPRQWLDCTHETAQALEEAHRLGLVHRDLKPSNVMLTIHGHVKVLDFGLAKQVDTPAGAGAATTTGLTDPGTRLGTPAYMSPEQVLGSPLDARSDIFSFGVMLHEIASGRHPFQRATPADTMAAILRDPPAATEGDLDLAPGFGRIVHRMLAKACAERYQSMRELRADLEALRDAVAGSTPAVGQAGSAPVSPERSVFVARDDELQMLTAHLDQMLLGGGGLVLVGGEPGVGKTRLARELQRLARARGCLTLTGQSYEQEGAPPFGPFAETLEQTARLVPQAMQAALGEIAPEVAVLAPVLRLIFPDIVDPPVVPPDQQRRLLFNAYAEYVQRGTRKSAAVVLFDDLHWADDASLQLLLHLAPRLSTMRLLIVGTYRDVELDSQRPFARALETLLRQRLATRIALKRLDQDGVAQLLATLGRATPPSGFARLVHQETDGNPFFVEEVFQHLAEEGRLFDDAGRWKENLRADDIDVPEGVRLVISRRLDRLGGDARRVLTGGAVIGRSFALDVLLAVTDASEDLVLDTLEHAERAQLLRAERGREARYTFVHELIRATLVSGIALPRRQRLHAKIADVLERLRPSSDDAPVAMLAHHLYQAGTAVDVTRTSEVLMQAAGRALQSAAFEDALLIVDQLRSLEPSPGSHAQAVADETEAHALSALKKFDESSAPALRAFETWIALQNDAGILRVAESLSNAYAWGRGGVVAGRQVVERALNAVSPTAQGERALLQSRLALWFLHEGRSDEALAMRDAALAAAPALDTPAAIGALHWMLAEFSMALNRVTEGLTLIETASTQLEGTRHWQAVDALRTHVNLEGQAGRPNHARTARLLALAESLGHVGGVWIGRMWVDDVLRTGDTAALRDDRQALLETFGLPLWKFIDQLLAAGALLWAGQILDARRHLLEARNGVDGTAWGALPAIALAGFAAWTEDGVEARAALTAIGPLLPTAGRHCQVGAWYGVDIAVAAWALLGDRDQVAALYPAIAERVGLGHVFDTATLGPNITHVNAGTAASAAGLADRAAAHFADAHDVAERLGYPVVKPLVDLWHGKHLRDLGPDTRQEGEGRLRAAADGFAAVKAPLHEALARRWLARA